MFRSYEVSSINTIIWAFVFSLLYADGEWQWPRLTPSRAPGRGLQTVDLALYLDQKEPVREIAESTQTGSAPRSSRAWRSAWRRVCGAWWHRSCTGHQQPGLRDQGLIYVLYGVAMVGMLHAVPTGNNVAMDS